MKRYMKKLMHQDLKIRIKWLSMVVVLLTTLTSCLSQKSSKYFQNTPKESELQLLLEDSYFYSDSLMYEVVNNEKDLQKFFARVNMTRKPGLPVPKVDFNENDVLIVCFGKTKSNIIPNIHRVDEETDKIIYEVSKKHGKESSVISYPFQVFMMRKMNKKLIVKQVKN